MKFALTALAAVAAASPIFEQETFNAEPGFSLDLNAQRLVQLEGQPPVWMTELEKVRLSPCIAYIAYSRRADKGQGPEHQVLRHVQLSSTIILSLTR